MPNKSPSDNERIREAGVRLASNPGDETAEAFARACFEEGLSLEEAKREADFYYHLGAIGREWVRLCIQDGLTPEEMRDELRRQFELAQALDEAGLLQYFTPDDECGSEVS